MAESSLKCCFVVRSTQYGDDLVILNDFEGTRDHEAESVDALTNMEDEVARGAVGGLKLHGQGAKAAVAGQAEGRVVVEDLPVEVDADVRPHVFGTNGEDLSREGDLRTSLRRQPRLASGTLPCVCQCPWTWPRWRPRSP